MPDNGWASGTHHRFTASYRQDWLDEFSLQHEALLQLLNRDANAVKQDLMNPHRKGAQQWHKNREITQKSGHFMPFLLQITGIHPDFEIKLKKSAGLLLGKLNFN